MEPMEQLRRSAGAGRMVEHNVLALGRFDAKAIDS